MIATLASERARRPSETSISGKAALPQWAPSPLGRDSHLVFATEPTGIAADQYRKAARRLDMPGLGRRILVTSPGQQDGKSTTASNLAWALSERGHSVLLVELDLRRPTLSKIFSGLRAPVGIDDVLSGTGQPEQMTCRVQDTTLDVACVHRAQHNAARLIQNTALESTLTWCQSQYDWLVLDTPPVLAVADTLELLAHADPVLLVVRARSTRTALVRPAIEMLGPALKHVLFNYCEMPSHSHYYSYMPPNSV